MSSATTWAITTLGWSATPKAIQDRAGVSSPYSVNLNLIERYWELFKKKVLYNRCYEKFQDFKKARVRFFRQSRRYLKALRSLLADNFPILGRPDWERKTLVAMGISVNK